MVYGTTTLVRAAVLSLLAGSMSVAAWAGQKQSATAIGPASTGVFHTFPGSPKVAISNHGNLVKFEAPVGYEHIGVGDLSEGYVLCYGGSSRAWDTGSSESGFGPATASCTSSACTITRNTSDGILQL